MAARQADGATGTMNVALRQQTAVLSSARGAMGLTATEGLNLSRQFTDIGVTAAMGMNPLMIAIQQGPQILDTFQMAAQRTGTSVKAVMLQAGAAIWTAMAPLLPFIAAAAAAAAVIGGTLALATRAMNKEAGDLTEGLGLTADQLENVQNKGVTMGDVVVGSLRYLQDVIWDQIGPTVTKIGDWFSETMDRATRFVLDGVKFMVGAFIGAYRGITAIWGDLPAVIGDLAISAANAAIRAIENMLNKAREGINVVIMAAKELAKVNPAFSLANGLSPISAVNLGEISNQNAGAARRAGVRLAEEMAAGMAEGGALVDRQLGALEASITSAAERRIMREAGEAADPRSRRTRTPVEREVMMRTENISLNELNAVVQMLPPLQVLADELKLIDGLAQDAARGRVPAQRSPGRPRTGDGPNPELWRPDERGQGLLQGRLGRLQGASRGRAGLSAVPVRDGDSVDDAGHPADNFVGRQQHDPGRGGGSRRGGQDFRHARAVRLPGRREHGRPPRQLRPPRRRGIVAVGRKREPTKRDGDGPRSGHVDAGERPSVYPVPRAKR